MSRAPRRAPSRPRPESPLRIVLALSPLKGDRMELAIQKATELGVAEVWPVVTARTDAAARPALQRLAQERWEKVASGAAEQCGRAVVPDVAADRRPSTVSSPSPSTDGASLLLETPGPASARLALADAAGRPPPAVGPAGGWEPAEVERLARPASLPAALGPRILRAETAAVAAVAVAQALWGDLAP